MLPARGNVHNNGVINGGAQAEFVGSALVPTADIPGGAWVVASQMRPSSASRMFGVALAVELTSMASFAITACSTSIWSYSAQEPQQSQATTSQELRGLNADAPLTHVETGGATLARVMAETPCVYPEVRVKDTMEESRGDGRLTGADPFHRVILLLPRKSGRLVDCP